MSTSNICLPLLDIPVILNHNSFFGEKTSVCAIVSKPFTLLWNCASLSDQPSPPGNPVDPDYYVNWKPPLIPPGQGRRLVRIAIIVLAVVLVIMSAVALWRSNLVALSSGRGEIVGRVVAPTAGAVVFTLANPTEIPVAFDGSFTHRLACRTRPPKRGTEIPVAFDGSFTHRLACRTRPPKRGTEIPVAFDGSFTLSDVPSGRQMLYVALSGVAWEIPVDVPNQGVVDVGVITVEVTAEPIR
jgi:hypothetical protein